MPSGTDARQPSAAARHWGARGIGLLPLAALALTLAPIAVAAPPPPVADELAAPVVDELTDALGGQAAWDQIPYFRFDFVIVRAGQETARYRHWWDKRRGRCRVEGLDGQGRPVVAIFNLADRTGRSFTNGLPDLDSASVAANIDWGYRRWVNDTYWVIMPFKLRDPGARLKHVRRDQTDDGVEYDVLELSFAPGVGLTPRDRYWLFVNRTSHLIDRWHYLLEGRSPPPQEAAWEAWSNVGPLRLSLARRVVGGDTLLRFENVAAPERMGEEVFTHSSLR